MHKELFIGDMGRQENVENNCPREWILMLKLMVDSHEPDILFRHIQCLLRHVLFGVTTFDIFLLPSVQCRSTQGTHYQEMGKT